MGIRRLRYKTQSVRPCDQRWCTTRPAFPISTPPHDSTAHCSRVAPRSDARLDPVCECEPTHSLEACVPAKNGAAGASTWPRKPPVPPRSEHLQLHPLVDRLRDLQARARARVSHRFLVSARHLRGRAPPARAARPRRQCTPAASSTPSAYSSALQLSEEGTREVAHQRVLDRARDVNSRLRAAVHAGLEHPRIPVHHAAVRPHRLFHPVALRVQRVP
jgi:hypothetical protein